MRIRIRNRGSGSEDFSGIIGFLLIFTRLAVISADLQTWGRSVSRTDPPIQGWRSVLFWSDGLVPDPRWGPKISKTVCFKSQTESKYFPLIKFIAFRKNIGSLKRKDANSAEKITDKNSRLDSNSRILPDPRLLHDTVGLQRWMLPGRLPSSPRESPEGRQSHQHWWYPPPPTNAGPEYHGKPVGSHWFIYLARRK